MSRVSCLSSGPIVSRVASPLAMKGIAFTDIFLTPGLNFTITSPGI